MYEDQFIHPDKTGRALVDGRGVNEGLRPSLIILPDGADPEEQIQAILESDSRMTRAHTTMLVCIILVGLIVFMEVMLGVKFLSNITPSLPVVISALLAGASLAILIFARRGRPSGLLLADISLRDILTEQNVADLRHAKESERKEDYLDLQERIAAKRGRNLGIDPQNKVVG